jgi:hypothetical protein
VRVREDGDGLLVVVADLISERRRQDAKFGHQRNYHDGTGRPGDREAADEARARCKANGPAEDNWRDVLDEEVCEAFAETDPELLRAELVQVMAVAGNWIEHIDRRESVTRPKPCPTCSWPSRETVGLVCQTCGRDYSTADAAAGPEPDWVCIDCGYHNSGSVCTHCGRPLAVAVSTPEVGG